MKVTFLTIASLAIALTLASCSKDEPLNQQPQPAASPTTTAPSATPATPPAEMADFKVDMSPANIALGHATYHVTCAPCHGEGGKGDGPAAVAFNPKPRDHTNGEYMDKLTNAHIYQVVHGGGAQFGYPNMPPQPQMAPDTIKNAIAFVRSLSKTWKQ